MLHLWGRRICLFLLLAGLLVGSGSNRQTARVRAGETADEPIWGRKPVLAYFALTGRLAEDMRAGARLDADQFELVQSIARRESDAFKRLAESSGQIIQDESLSISEKRVRIEQSGYRLQVAQIITGGQIELKAALGVDTYDRLVDWIEARWQLERAAHGDAQLSVTPAGKRKVTVYATHYDSNGSYAVALPDKCLKFANGGSSICNGSGFSTGQAYSVRLSYDQSVVVQAFDSGPWNVDDNFWTRLDDPQPRRLFTDLPMGMPAAQAAYFDDYNDGKDQFGRTVTAPFALDLGDHVGSDIGLNPGMNDWVEVTFRWTDGWDALQEQVVTLLEPTSLQPPYTGDMCITAWHRIFPLLEDNGRAAYLTLNVDDPAQSTNSAEWEPVLPISGKYLVRAFVPDHDPIDWLCPSLHIPIDTADAEYTIHHASGKTTVSRNQGPMANQYLDLGTYQFESGDGARVELSDLNDEENLSHTIAFSAMQFRQVLPPATPTPTPLPSPTPTPTPTPDPYLRAGFGLGEQNAAIQIVVDTGNLQNPGLGQAVVELQFDPAVADATGCQADPDNLFDMGSCQPDFDADGIFPDAARLTAESAGGAPGNPLLARFTFQLVGAAGDFSWLDVVPIQLSAAGGGDIAAEVYAGFLCITPCRNVSLFPFTFNEGE